MQGDNKNILHYYREVFITSSLIYNVPSYIDMMSKQNIKERPATRNPDNCSTGCIAATTNKDRDELNRLLALEEGKNVMIVISGPGQ